MSLWMLAVFFTIVWRVRAGMPQNMPNDLQSAEFGCCRVLVNLHSSLIEKETVTCNL